MAFDLSAKVPVAEKRPVSVTHHGIDKTDDYDWLRAENWQEVMRDPSALPDDIRAYLDAENAYQDAQMADTAGLRDALFDELKDPDEAGRFVRAFAARCLFLLEQLR